MPDFKDKVELEAEAIAETDGALLCRIDGDDAWIPKSHIHDDSEVYEKGHEGTLVISEWIAKQKGLV
jgi:hypothetical protein